MEELRGKGDEERVGWADTCIEKATQKLEEKERGVRELERAVAGLEGMVGELPAKGRLVEKKKVGGGGAVVEEPEKMVKGEGEKKVKREGEATSGVSNWLRGFLGYRDGTAILDLPCPPPPRSWRAPTHPGLDTPFLLAPESPMWTLPFILHRIHAKILAWGGGMEG